DIQNDEEQGADDIDAQEQPNLDEDVHPEFRVPMPPFVPLRRLDLEVEQMYVKTAFLHGDLDKEIYMEQPEGF
nr:retrovirus-related Pol polyprotein from transposon TNT 1-94 [Tanacetum cinerariifolium]